jgi:hypothetical protein
MAIGGLRVEGRIGLPPALLDGLAVVARAPNPG